MRSSDLELLLSRTRQTVDRRIDLAVPRGVSESLRGVVESVDPASRTAMTRLDGSALAVPIPYLAMPASLVAGDLVIVERVMRSGALTVTGIYGRDPLSTLSMYVDVRDFSDWSEDGDKAKAVGLALAEASPGTVFVPNGTHHMGSGVTVPADCRLLGAGMFDTTLVRGFMTPGAETVPVIRVDGALADLSVSGSYSTYGNLGIGAYAEVLVGDHATAERIRVSDFACFGVDMTGSTYPVLRDSVVVGNALGSTGVEAGEAYVGVLVYGLTGLGAEISRCHISDCHANAIQAGSRGVRILDCILLNNHLMDDETWGGQIDVTGSETIISGCYIDGSVGGAGTSGIECWASQVVIANNIIANHGANGIYIGLDDGGASFGGGDDRIIGNVIKNSGMLTAAGVAWGAAIQANAGVSGLSVIGNHIFDDQTPKTQTYAIYIATGASDDIIISDNDLNGNDSGPLSSGATGTEITITGNVPTSINDAGGGGGGPPSGAAGGDLGGSYPNPTVDDDSHAHTSSTVTPSGIGAAPSTVDYLVGTASGGLSAEIVVGTSPGGELGNTWASPTVDASHSGSTHAATQAAAEATAAGALSTHAAAADPHAGYQQESEKGAANGYASLDAGSLVPVAQHGTGTPDGTKFLRDDRTWVTPSTGGAPTTADYLVGTTQGGLSAEIVVGTSPGGELGGTWASPTVDTTHSGSSHAGVVTTHEGAADPHTGYVLESLFAAKGDLLGATANDTPAILAVGANDTMLMADSAAASGLKWVASAAPVAVGTANAAGTSDDFSRASHVHAHEAAHIDHDTTWAAKGDLIAGTANDTAAVLGVGANDTILMADSAQATGLKWVASATPTTQAFGDAAAAGTSDDFSRGSHKHGMPATVSISAVTGAVVVTGTDISSIPVQVSATHASYAGRAVDIYITRAANAAYEFMRCFSGVTADTEVILRGDGAILSDNAATTPADYAEYLESEDGDAIAYGISVVMAGERIRPALADDPPSAIIGVIRPPGSSALVGNSHWGRHHGKYLRDEYGGPILDDAGERVLSPDHDPDAEYVNREARPEWCIVGLLGQIPVDVGQPIGDRWIRMGSVSPTVDMYLVR